MSLAMIVMGVSALLALVLMILGVVFIKNPAKGFELTSHEPSALTKVMGGRYVGLGLIILGLLWVGNTQALGVAFAVGAFLGFFDGVVTSQAGGKAIGHHAVGVITALLAFYFLTAQPVVGA